jgi:hypothetical protein
MNREAPITQAERLREKAQLREHVFTSTTPVVGGLIARFRAAWNNVSTRWYVRPLADQQTEFNRALLDYIVPRLSNYDKHLRYFEENLPRFDEMDARILVQDQRQVELTHDLAETVARLIQMEHRLGDIEARLSSLETRN